ncbi:MAG: NAD(P)-binding domain-containing protein, partial [Tannerellaceae bacterium]|nr:NAD(P)-binding domain-containing protein [Tannerellaceae bacterium]
MKKIGIIGIGKIGSQLAFDFLKDDFISEMHISNRNPNRLKALIQSLKTAAFQYERDILIKELDFKNINALDLILISAKESYDPRIMLTQNGYPDWFPRNLRYCGFYDDIQILKSITSQLSCYKGIIAVITNPVEIMTKYVSENVNNAHVFGLGTSLDSSRISFLIHKEYSIEVDANEILLFGEHGNNINIVSNLLPVGIKNYPVHDIVVKSNGMGFDIVKKIGYTLFDCIFPFSNDIKWLLKLNLSGKYKFRSLSYPKSGLIISQPIF